MKKFFACLAFVLFTSQIAWGQIKIGDNPQNIDPSAVLELESTDKALIITRVTNAQMNAIVPSRGALVYNVDEQCVFYYNGTQWESLCGSGGATDISFSTEALANNLNDQETIVITQNGTNYNFEVAPNSINSSNIVDGGVNGVDIQNSSIGQDKLANDAVERDNLATNSVGLDALDTNEVTLNTLTNDAGFITSADIISPDENNAISYVNGAFYDDGQLKGDIATNTDVIEAHLINDEDVSPSNELQDLTLNGTVLEIEQGNNVDLGPIISAGGSDDQNLVLTGDVLSIESGTGSVDLSTYVNDADASATNELITRAELVGTNLIIEEGSGNDYSVPLGGLGGGGTTEEVDDVTLTGAGTAGNPFKIKDAGIGLIHLSDMGATTNGQILKWNGTAWTIGTDVSGGTGFTDTDADDDGLAYDATAGYDVNVDNTTLEINTDQLRVKDGGIGLTHLSDMGATANGQILKWNGTAWAIGTDVSGGTGFTDTDADDDGLAYDATDGYDVNVDDSTIEIDTDQLQLKDGGIGLAHLSDMGATANGQILKWNGTVWAIGTDVSGGTGFTDTDADDDGLAYDATTGYDVNVDDSTIEIDTDQLQLKDGGIGLTHLSDMGATANGQILKWNGTAWAIGTDVSGGTGFTDTDADDDGLAYDATGGYDVNVDDSTIEIDTDQLQLKDGGIGLAHLSDMGATANGQILKWNGTAWAIGTDVSGGTGFTDTDADDDGLAYDATTGYDVNVDDSTLEINSDQIRLKDGGIGLTHLSDMGATADQEGEVIRWNATSNTWEVGLPAPHTGTTNSVFFAGSDGSPIDAESSGQAGNSGGFFWDPTSRFNTGALYLGFKNAGTGDTPSPSTTNRKSKLVVAERLPGGIAYPIQIVNEVSNEFDNNSAVGLLFSPEFQNPHGRGALVYERSVFEGNGNWGRGDFHFLQNTTTNNTNNPTIADAVMTIKNDGKVGIGTTVPNSKLEVIGQIRSSTIANGDGEESLPSYRFKDNLNSGMWSPGLNVLGFSTNSTEALRIDASQNVGIGPAFSGGSTIGARLHVDGNIWADGEIKASGIVVENDNGPIVPDYVFQKYFLGTSELKVNYDFKTLEEVEAFIKKHHHLPGITSAAEAKKQGVWNLSASNLQNLEKIEELFLYTIEQQKKIEALQLENNTLKTELESLKKDLGEIKALLLKGHN